MYSSVRLSHLVQWTGGKLVGNASLEMPITVPNSDTRTIKKGDVFIALRGEKYNANDFLDDAARKGAALIIAEKACSLAPTLVVPDSLKALVQIATELRKQFKGKVVGITGSAGKSSTKEMVATLLGDNVVKSPASFNNLLGVSKTLCLVEDTTKALVLEMGMNAFGEIAELCQHFSPQAGLITNIGDAHIGKLGGKEGIYRAKKELFDHLAKQDSPRVGVNIDDPMVVKAFQEAFGGKAKSLSYSSQGKKADVQVVKQSVNPQKGFLDLDLQVEGEKLHAAIPIFGKHHAENIAAAIAISRLLEVPLSDIRARLAKIKPAYHRGEVVVFPDGRVLIDESYNSNPTALHSALATLSELDVKRRRILVLGEMKELGEYSEKLHRESGEAVVRFHQLKSSPLVVIGVGEGSKALVEAVKAGAPGVETFRYSNVQEATAPIQKLFRAPEDVLFIKGSRGVALDLLVKSLSP